MPHISTKENNETHCTTCGFTKSIIEATGKQCLPNMIGHNFTQEGRVRRQGDGYDTALSDILEIIKEGKV